jgi:hypothetical protein
MSSDNTLHTRFPVDSSSCLRIVNGITPLTPPPSSDNIRNFLRTGLCFSCQEVKLQNYEHMAVNIVNKLYRRRLLQQQEKRS